MCNMFVCFVFKNITTHHVHQFYNIIMWQSISYQSHNENPTLNQSIIDFLKDFYSNQSFNQHHAAAWRINN